MVAALLCVLAAGGIVVLLVADSWVIEGNLAFTSVALLLLGVVAAVGLSVAATSLAWLGWLCVTVAVAAFGFAMGAMWSTGELEEGNPDLYKAAGTLIVFSFALADSVLVLSRWRPDSDRLLRAIVAATLLAVFALAILFTIVLVAETGDETYFRVTAVVAVLWALGTALIPLLRGPRRAA